MQNFRRVLQESGELAAAPSVGSNAIIILAALLGALICVVGLALVARRVWLRRFPGEAPPPPQGGLKGDVVRSLPRLLFRCGVAAAPECPICLTEFVVNEEIRVLPFCGHSFHIACIDLWLASHSSCPSCRHNLGDACSAVAGLSKSGGAATSLPGGH